MDVLQNVDKKLAEIAKLKEEYNKINQAAQKELEQVKSKYQDSLGSLEEQIKAADESIRQYLKKHKVEIFGDFSDMAEVEHGSVFYRSKLVVHRARGVLKKLEEMDLKEAIKITKSVKWDIVEKWPDEKLEMIGTKRKKREDFEYEING